MLKIRKCPPQSTRASATSSIRTLKSQEHHYVDRTSAPSKYIRSPTQSSATPSRSGGVLRGNRQIGLPTVLPFRPPKQAQYPPDREASVVATGRSARPQCIHSPTQSSSTPARSGGVLRCNRQIGPPTVYPLTHPTKFNDCQIGRRPLWQQADRPAHSSSVDPPIKSQYPPDQ